MMDVVFCVDNNYVMPCGIAITSLLENNDGLDISIHVIGLNVSDSNKMDLERAVTSYNSHIYFYDIEEQYLNSFNFSLETENTYLSMSAFSRLFIADILPLNIDKALYLDSDVLIVENLSNLWNISIDKYSLAGVADAALAYDTRRYEKLKLLDQFLYINSGILLINLQYWRSNEILKKFIKYEIENRSNIEFHDQDIINGVLHASILRLPLKYNVQMLFYKEKVNPGFSEKEIDDACNLPTILHFTSNVKPWEKGPNGFHPKTKKYIEIKNKSVWKDVPIKWEKGTTLNKKVRYYKRLLLYFMRLDKRKFARG